MAAIDRQNVPGNTRIRSYQALAGKVVIGDFASTTSGEDTVVPFAVPRNSIIKSAVVVTTTAFNGTTPAVEVGTSSDDDGFVASASVTALGSDVGSGTLLNATTGAADLPVHVKLSWGTNKPTAGEMTVVVTYVEFGKDAGAPHMGQVREVVVS